MSYNGSANWSTWNLYNLTAGSNEAAYNDLIEIAEAHEAGDTDRDEYVDLVREYCETEPMLEWARKEIDEEKQHSADEGMDKIDWNEFANDFLDQ